MNINEVIKYPILSEKTYAQMSTGVYTFAVDPRTNRAEVKQTVEFIFDVKVAKVNIINVDKQPKKMGRSQGFTNKVKKAIITLSEGVINIFPEEAAVEETTKEAPAKKEVKAKEVKEMSDAEKKAAEKIAAKLKEKEAVKETAEKTETKETTKDEK